jgi:methyltransferase
MTAAAVILVLVTLQRLGELVLASRNTRALKAAGAVEHGAGHYPLIVLLHAAWLAGLWWLGRDAAVQWGWLAAFVVLQALRVWVIATLGRRWTTRIIVPPEEPPVRRGPYRWVRHPNYAVVAAEIPVLPFALELTAFGFLFGVLNLAVLALRIRAENRALGTNAALAP